MSPSIRALAAFVRDACHVIVLWAALLAATGAGAQSQDSAVAVAEVPEATPQAEAEGVDRPFEILGEEIEEFESRLLELPLSESFAGQRVTTPIQVIRGDKSGPTICLVAGIHGDEIVGIEIVRRIVGVIDPQHLRGTVIAVPIANSMGFRRLSRYLPDRRDLNRYFPGRPDGSAASRVANRIFEQVVRRCQILVDFHTGSFHRANMPQVRADLDQPQLLGLATWFGVPVVVHSEGQIGTLRRAATDAGIQAVLYEAGEPMRFDENAVSQGVEGTLSMLRTLGMLDPVDRPPVEYEVFYGRHWIRAEDGGIFQSQRELGDRVVAGTPMGTVTDPFTNEQSTIYARSTGRIIGRALDQVVIPGFALYHIGTARATNGREEEPSETAEEMAPELDERPE